MAKTFDLGLVMAGAISAGAYTAGVVDFLLFALEEWERERKRHGPNENFPHHRVRLKVLAGSSAGGMTAALAAVRLCRKDGGDLLRSAWVEQVNMLDLLGTSDLNDGTPRSVLNGRPIAKIAADAVGAASDPTVPCPAYLTDPVDILLTVSNLRGVPYATRFAGTGVSRYEMLTHGDVFRFVLGTRHATAPGRLAWGDFADPTWRSLTAVAVATGAFPVAFPACRFDRDDVAGYADLVGRVVYQDGKLQRVPVPPAVAPTPPHRFDAVDGGMINNEPVTLARRAMGLDEFDPSDGAGRAALVLVDPFPNVGVYQSTWPDEQPALLGTLPLVLSTLINQARFQADEMARALSPDVFTQYMITPRRRPPTPAPAEPLNIACGSLGGFGGLLHQAFRAHDYDLGRRNCQKFLRDRFTLPVVRTDGSREPLFDGWDPPRVNVRDGGFWADERDEHNRVLRANSALPIVPVVGRAAEPLPRPKWPTGAFRATDLKAFERALAKRLRRVGLGSVGGGFSAGRELVKGAMGTCILIRPLVALGGIPVAATLGLGAWAAGRQAARRAAEHVRTQLAAHGLWGG